MSVKSKHKASKIGNVPSDWKVMTLGEIGETVSGLTYSPKNIDENGVLVLRSSNVQDRKIQLQDNVFVNVDEDDYNPVKENDLLICVRNGSRSLIGKNALIKKEHEGLAFGAFMSIFRSEDNNYLYQLFDTDFYNQEIHRNLGATINSINGSNLKKFKFPFPPKNERQKIAEILSQWDEAIETTTHLIEKLQLRKKGLMQELLSGKKRLAGFGKEWKEFQFGDLLKDVKRPVDWNDEELYDLISVRRRSGGLFFRESLYGNQILTKNLKTAKTGDFLISKMQIVHGASGLVAEEYDGAKISGSYLSLRVIDENRTDINFINWLSKTPFFYYQTLVSSYGVHIEKMTFNFKLFLKSKIRIPKIEEQRMIVEILETAQSEINNQEEKLSQLKISKKGLMQQLLTGQKRVKI